MTKPPPFMSKQPEEALSSYLLRLLTCLASLNNGELRIPLSAWIDIEPGHGVYRYYDRERKELVLRFVENAIDVYAIPKEAKEPCPQPANLPQAQRSPRSSLSLEQEQLELAKELIQPHLQGQQPPQAVPYRTVPPQPSGGNPPLSTPSAIDTEVRLSPEAYQLVRRAVRNLVVGDEEALALEDQREQAKVLREAQQADLPLAEVSPQPLGGAAFSPRTVERPQPSQASPRVQIVEEGSPRSRQPKAQTRAGRFSKP